MTLDDFLHVSEGTFQTHFVNSQYNGIGDGTTLYLDLGN